MIKVAVLDDYQDIFNQIYLIKLTLKMSSKFFGNRLEKNVSNKIKNKPLNKNSAAKKSTAVRKTGRGN